MTPREERDDGSAEGIASLHGTFESLRLSVGVSLTLVAIALWETIFLRDTARAQND